MCLYPHDPDEDLRVTTILDTYWMVLYDIDDEVAIIDYSL